MKGGEKGCQRGLGGGDEERWIWGRKGRRGIEGGRRLWRLTWYWEVEVEVKVETGRERGRDSASVRAQAKKEKREAAA